MTSKKTLTEKELFNKDVADLSEEDVFRLLRLKQKIEEATNDITSEEDRPYMLWFGALCDEAGSELGRGKDRQFLWAEAKVKFDKKGNFLGVDYKMAKDPRVLPTITGQVFSREAATKIGKYIAGKLGKTLNDVEKDLSSGKPIFPEEK